MERATIAAQLRELAVYYELDGDKHRAFAYDRAAKSIDGTNNLHRLIEEGRLEELPGIGPSIARVIADLYRQGTVPVLERMRAAWPPLVIELAQLPKVGVPKARKIFQTIAPKDLEDVAAACRAGRLSEIPGFGKVSEQRILQSIEERHTKGAQVILFEAEDHAASLAAFLRADPAARRVEVCGPVRRAAEIVDHLAFAVATEDREAIGNRLAAYGLVTSIDRGAEPGPLVGFMAGGLRAEVYVARPGSFGWAHVRATGSKEHLALLEARAGERGLDLGKLEAPDERLVYRSLGMPWLPPEVRDGTDEIAAALAGDSFHDLVTLDDLTVAAHCHTTYSDGKNTVAEMVRGAAEQGFAGITITDHSAAATYAGGLDLTRLRAQAAEIAGLAAPEARVLRGTEADILADGSVDVPPELIDELDLIIASVHQRYKLDEDGTTRRLLAMVRQPFFKIWGHALGRLLLRRDPIAVRLDEVLDAAAESGTTAIEINGDPYRLDLDPVNARKAAARGLPFVLACDAHSVNGLRATRHAVAMARRARIRRRQVLNARPVDELAAIVRPRGA